MRSSIARPWAWLGAFVLFTMSGCGGPTPPPFNNSVEGTVKLDGTPLAGVTVMFTPKGIPGLTLPGSNATTDDKGHFSLTADNGKPGALACEHNVTVHQGRGDRSNAPDAPAPGAAKKSGPPVPVRYGAASTSGLVVDIKPDQHTYDLNLTR